MQIQNKILCQFVRDLAVKLVSKTVPRVHSDTLSCGCDHAADCDTFDVEILQGNE